MSVSTDNRFRNGVFLVYPDSAPANWIDILRQQHVPFIVSPLHDKDHDLSELDGDLCLVTKKAHWHVAVTCDGNKPLSYFCELSKSVNGSTAWKIQNLRSMLRYFCHMDNPEKYQYPVNEIRTFCGADYQSAMELSGIELTMQVKKIWHYCKQKKITSLKALVDNLDRDGEDEWLHIVSSQRTYFFAALLKDTFFIEKEKNNGV